MNEHDDFPLSPNSHVDVRLFYEAFLKAEEFLANVPRDSRGTNPDRMLHDVARDLYASHGRSSSLLRARVGAPEAAAAVWLSRVRALAEWFIVSNDVPPFAGVSATTLSDLASMSGDVAALPDVFNRLFELGIVLVHERAIPGAKVDGAVFKARSGHPVIGISLRYARLDHYWFTLMHELAHVVLHENQLSTPIVDDLDEDRPALVEKQADKLAGDSLIPRHEWRSCPAKYSLDVNDILIFAKRLKIAPQIVAGRLRRELRRHEIFSDLVNEVDVREVLLG